MLKMPAVYFQVRKSAALKFALEGQISSGRTPFYNYAFLLSILRTSDSFWKSGMKRLSVICHLRLLKEQRDAD